MMSIKPITRNRWYSLNNKPFITWEEIFAFRFWMFGAKILIQESQTQMSKGRSLRKSRQSLIDLEKNKLAFGPSKKG